MEGLACADPGTRTPLALAEISIHTSKGKVFKTWLELFCFIFSLNCEYVGANGTFNDIIFESSLSLSTYSVSGAGNLRQRLNYLALNSRILLKLL